MDRNPRVTVPMASVLGFGEQVAVINNDLLSKAINEQAPEAQKKYGQASGARDADVMMLRLDLSSMEPCLAAVLAVLIFPTQRSSRSTTSGPLCLFASSSWITTLLRR